MIERQSQFLNIPPFFTGLTYVEFNGVNRDQRIHIPYILEPDAEIAPKGADDNVGIEVNVNGVMFGAGSPHHNGGFYEQLGKANEIRILDKTQAFMLQNTSHLFVKSTASIIQDMNRRKKRFTRHGSHICMMTRPE